MEYHNEVVPYIFRNIGSRHLPSKGLTIVHLDSHPDLLIPKKMESGDVFDKAVYCSLTDIADWLLPSAYSEVFKSIVWVKPPWAKQMPEGAQTFRIGRDKNDHLRVDSKLSYFVAECLYCPTDELQDAKEVDLEVVTLGKRIEEESDDFNAIRTSLLRYIKEESAYILDIDLDFFSTSNPFQNVYSKAKMYERVKELCPFKPPASQSDQDVKTAVQKREQQTSELEQLFCTLDEHRKLDISESTAPPNPLICKVEELRNALLENYKDEEIDWPLVYDSFWTCDDTPLPHHVSTMEELETMFEAFGTFLEALPKPPVIVTISRSSVDDYTPEEDVEFIQTKVVELVKKKFECDEPVVDLGERSSEESAKN